MPTPAADTPGAPRPDVRRPTGPSRFGLVSGLFATAGTVAVAFVGLGGPPAPTTPVALADATATEPAVPRVVVKTVYVRLPSPTAAPVAPVAPPLAAVQKPVSRAVTRQSGAGGEGGEGREHEGDD